MGVEDGECGNAFGDRDFVLLSDINILVHVADVDVDEDEVLGEELGVGALVVVNVEELAVATPVASEVEEDAFVLAAGLGDGDGDVGCGVGALGVQVGIGLEEAGLAVGVSWSREAEYADDGGCDGEERGTGLRRHRVRPSWRRLTGKRSTLER